MDGETNPKSGTSRLPSSAVQLKLILSVDRLDYSKGIPGRIKAYECFLQRYPQYLGKVSLLMIVVPTGWALDPGPQWRTARQLSWELNHSAVPKDEAW